jgi:outer membrane protein W
MNGGSLLSPLVLPGAELAVGGDYLLTRRWAVGLSIREHFLFTDLGTYPSYLTVTARVELNWGGL